MLDATTLLQQKALLNELQNDLRYAAENPAVFDYLAVGTPLSSAQVGSGVSTNFLDSATYALPAGALFRFVTTIGATPTCTYAIQGSPDNVNWSAVNCADSATPTTFSNATFVITTAVTKLMYVQPGQYARFLRVNYTANTNVTNTCDVIVF